MKTKLNIYKLFAVIMAVIVLGGCNLIAAPAVPTASPTTAPTVAAPTDNIASTLDMVKTQAAQTVIANLTLSAPTATLANPTSIPTATVPALPTITPLPPTPNATATSSSYNCRVTAVVIKPSRTLKVNTAFTTNWTVKNTGSETWAQHAVDVKFISGTAMQTKGSLFDLTATVAPKDSITIVINMKTPFTAGTYWATWGIVQANIFICELDMGVQVNN